MNCILIVSKIKRLSYYKMLEGGKGVHGISIARQNNWVQSGGIYGYRTRASASFQARGSSLTLLLRRNSKKKTTYEESKKKTSPRGVGGYKRAEGR